MSWLILQTLKLTTMQASNDPKVYETRTVNLYGASLESNQLSYTHQDYNCSCLILQKKKKKSNLLLARNYKWRDLNWNCRQNYGFSLFWALFCENLSSFLALSSRTVSVLVFFVFKIIISFFLQLNLFILKWFWNWSRYLLLLG